MAETPEDREIVSVLDKHPDHVWAIGMISVELANLETFLGELLGSLLHIHPINGRIIYLSPQSAMGRLAILENLHIEGKNVHAKGSGSHKTLTKILSKAKALIGKRHGYVHSSWGTASNETETHVATRSMPFKEQHPAKLVPLDELEDAIKQIRDLMLLVIDLTATNYASWPAYSSQPIPPPQSSPDPIQKPETPRKGRAPKPKAPPRSSRGKASG